MYSFCNYLQQIMLTRMHKKFLLTRMHKKFFGNTVAFKSIPSCIRNIRFYTKSETPNQSPNCILFLLQDYGFTHEEASTAISKRPILLSHTPKFLKPKLDFFKSVGMSPPDLQYIIISQPSVFRRSLQNQIIPTYDYLKTVLKTNENVNQSIKRSSCLFNNNLEKYLIPNLTHLLECGVPSDKLATLLRTQPRALVLNPDKFVEVVREAKREGFVPGTANFLTAIQLMTGFAKSTIERKKGVYKKWGWSDEQVLVAFQKAPCFLFRSDEKIDAVMDFLLNKMGWNQSEVAKCPHLLSHSLERWIVPRCLVYRFLLSKGLIKEKRIVTLLKEKKGIFLKNYVEAYSVEFPELLTIYQPKVVSLKEK